MKAGIFSPYLDSLGGGERYAMTVAECLAQKGWEVDVFWNNEAFKGKLEKRFKISLERVNFIENIFCSEKNLIERWQITRKYDLLFYVSDGSIPFLFAKNNILHFQIPFHGVNGKTVLNKLKLIKFNHIICNSYFTKKFIDQEYGISTRVVHPPVAVGEFEPLEKENLILTVSRFAKTMQAKKQEFLIDGFKKIGKEGLGGWRLVLAGGAKNEDKDYVKELKRMAKGWPVEILTNVDFPTLQRLYGKAKIFWHAAGAEEDEEKHPERMEHFGIAIVEAMAAGCVPVVIAKGGIPEIINGQENGFLWKTKEELVKLTIQLIKSPKMIKKVSVQAIKDSAKFSQEVFCRKINEFVEN